ncbi:MAG: DUF2318 domain-containing protein [Firmicutes bacterium]|nr:DUF2318 domain-containing protein [Bacillota bacterium]
MKNHEEKRKKVLGNHNGGDRTGEDRTRGGGTGGGRTRRSSASGGDNGGRNTNRWGWYLGVGLVIVATVGIGLQNLKGGAGTGNAGALQGATTVKVAPVNYSNQRIEQTNVQVVVSGGKIRIPLDKIEQYKLVSFEYAGSNQSGKGAVPLLAYAAPSGKVVTAVRLCEPCSSTSFHIEGSNLVCNTCGTVWSLEGLEGLSGGCQKYPPAAMQTAQDGGDAVMSVNEVAAWKPRV